MIFWSERKTKQKGLERQYILKQSRVTTKGMTWQNSYLIDLIILNNNLT